VFFLFFFDISDRKASLRDPLRDQVWTNFYKERFYKNWNAKMRFFVGLLVENEKSAETPKAERIEGPFGFARVLPGTVP